MNDVVVTFTIWYECKIGYQADFFEIGGTVGLAVNGTGGLANTRPTTGVTSGLGYFAQPIDYGTDRYDLTATYSTERLQVQLGYPYPRLCRLPA